MDNTAVVILLYRQVTGSVPYNAPLNKLIDYLPKTIRLKDAKTTFN